MHLDYTATPESVHSRQWRTEGSVYEKMIQQTLHRGNTGVAGTCGYHQQRLTQTHTHEWPLVDERKTRNGTVALWQEEREAIDAGNRVRFVVSGRCFSRPKP